MLLVFTTDSPPLECEQVMKKYFLAERERVRGGRGEGRSCKKEEGERLN